MKVTFLGTGTSQGVPVIACRCDVCLSSNEKDKRLRASVLFSTQGLNFVIDSGPDFRYQMLRSGVDSLEGVVFTHEHKDHIAGLDDVRAFNWLAKKPMAVYAEERVLKAIKNEFAYSFKENPYPGVPQINLNCINENSFMASGIKIIPIRGLHHKLPVLGFRINDFAYLTDFNYISEHDKKKLHDLKVLVVNGVRKEKHISHFSLTEAVDLIQELKPEQGYVTHISHQLGKHSDVGKELPENIYLAYDMLQLDI